MLQKFIGKIWKALPQPVRRRSIRVSQRKFTVSAAAVILNDKREVLLLNHVLRPYSDWGLPGGFLGPGEQPEEAIRREIREETGIALENLRMVRIRTIDKHVEIMYTATSRDAPEVKSREIISLGWFAGDKLPENLPRSQIQLIKQVLNAEV